ncbi:tetratricopeptide repeat protein [Bdellovibrio bacteriovorus]|uniref:tetratricopeptide repeat protein n=1 Tax=Bdellovibrio bacteriovorus TaxID=959 RepID=UPI0035A59D00
MVRFNFSFKHIVDDPKKRIPSILLGILALLCIAFTTSIKSLEATEVRRLIPPPPMIERMSFGYQEALADLLWIRSLQDFDYCEEKVSELACRNNSWLYQMIDAVTNLSPHFRLPYAAGALALTIIISDIDGATKIFDKGVKAFPKDWPILYRAAYHYLYEVKDKKRAAELLIQAGENGAPNWVFTLAGRLYSDSGHLELAESLLQEMIRTNQDPGLIKRLQDKINSMKK